MCTQFDLFGRTSSLTHIARTMYIHTCIYILYIRTSHARVGPPTALVSVTDPRPSPSLSRPTASHHEPSTITTTTTVVVVVVVVVTTILDQRCCQAHAQRLRHMPLIVVSSYTEFGNWPTGPGAPRRATTMGLPTRHQHGTPSSAVCQRWKHLQSRVLQGPSAA